MSNTNRLLSSLNIFTLVAVAAALLAYLLFFLRKKRNRHPMEGQPEENIAERIDESRNTRDHIN